jgi:tetratricopeptide (TPR) repeat protein
VVGKVFWAGAVAVIGNRGIDEVRSALRRMSKRGLVRPVRRTSMQGQEEYVFGHVLVRDVAYGQLPRGERARLHEAAAGWIEAVSGDRVGEVAELLAHHLATSLDLRPSEAPDRLARAYRYDMLAGERTKDLDAGRAVVFFRRAAGFARDARDRARALLELGRSLTGRIDEAAGALDEAVALFAGEGDREGQADALAARGTLEWYRGDAAATDRLTEELRALSEEMAPSESLARALGSIASKLQLRGREEEALEVVGRAIRVAQEVGSTTEYARGLVVRGSALAQLGEYEEEQDVAEALRVYLDRNDTRGALVAYNNHATFLAATGRVTEALEVIEEAIEFATQRGNAAAADWSRATACEALFPMGEWDRVLEISYDLIRADRERGGSQVGSFATWWRLSVVFWRGGTLEAHRMVEEGLAVARDIADPQVLMPALAIAAVVAEAVGDLGDARRLCEEFAATGSDHPGFLALHLPTVAPTMVTLGMADRAAALAAQAIGRMPWLDASIGRVRGLVDAARGDHERALAALRSAVEIGDGLSQRFWTALIRIEAARSALALGLEPEASALLAEARSAATAMGAVRLLDEIASVEGKPAPANATGS